MFDFHMHTRVSHDSVADPADMISAANNINLSEICFTDHYDFNSDPTKEHYLFKLENYIREYGKLHSDRLKIRHGVEFGLTPWNQKELAELIDKYEFDFVLGSIHFSGGYDPYYEIFWQGKSARQAFEEYLLQELACVKAHDGYDVLGHLNYVCKSIYNPSKKPLYYKDFSDLADEIMKTIISKGKGMEVNSSGVDRCGAFLPDKEFLTRFRELGGEIVTFGSDAHDATRVGQYSREALEILKDVFGYVCTFEKRKPIFHKL